MIARFGLQGFLFLCSAFFSGSETAMFSLSRLDLQKLRRERHPQSEAIHAMLDQPRRLIISILCGNELVNIAATVNLAGILVALYGPERAGVLNVLVMVPLLLLLGEVTPKTISVSNPLKISSRVVAPILKKWVFVVSPLRFLIRVVSDRITTWIVGRRDPENILRVEEFRTLLEDVAAEGELDATERVLIDNLLEASETEIVEIMTPRTRIKFLDADDSAAKMIEDFRGFQHPRVPVYRGNRDNLVGFVHAEDIVRHTFAETDLSTLDAAQLMRPPVVVPPTKHVDEMFDFFQANTARAAIVLNEFGGVDGLVTMRDVITFIFGEISGEGQDLHDERDRDVYDVAGDMKLTDFDDLTNLGIDDPRMTTVGGVVFRYLDRLPEVGDTVDIATGLTATVLEMDGLRLSRVRISKGGSTPEPSKDEVDSDAGTPRALERDRPMGTPAEVTR